MICEDTTKRYCCEDISKIENYEQANADTEMWDCHHRLEVNEFNASRSDKGIVSRQELIDDGMYYNRPACELIFMTRSEHLRMHALADQRGKKNGKKWSAKLTPEQRSEISKKGGKKGLAKLTPEQRLKGCKNGGKKGGKKNKGMLYWNNGTVNKRAKECPGPEWVPGQLRYKKLH